MILLSLRKEQRIINNSIVDRKDLFLISKRIELVTWYILWKTDSASRIRSFSCDVCKKKELYKNRVCFRYKKLNNRLSDPFVPVPAFDPSGQLMFDEHRHRMIELRQLDIEGFIKILSGIQNKLPDMPLFRILSIYFRKACPEAFVDQIAGRIIEGETEASTYTIDISNDSIRKELFGFDISLRDALDMFSVVRGTRNAFEKFMQEEIINKQNANKIR